MLNPSHKRPQVELVLTTISIRRIFELFRFPDTVCPEFSPSRDVHEVFGNLVLLRLQLRQCTVELVYIACVGPRHGIAHIVVELPACTWSAADNANYALILLSVLRVVNGRVVAKSEAGRKCTAEVLLTRIPWNQYGRLERSEFPMRAYVLFHVPDCG